MRLARLCFLAALCVVGAAADTFNFTYTVSGGSGTLDSAGFEDATFVFTGTYDTVNRFNPIPTTIAVPLDSLFLSIDGLSPVTFTGGPVWLYHNTSRHTVVLAVGATPQTIYSGAPTDETWVMLDGWELDRAISGMNVAGALGPMGTYATSGGTLTFSLPGWSGSGTFVAAPDATVPEPTGFALGALCLAALGLARRRFARR